jgi:hypothetical protein
MKKMSSREKLLLLTLPPLFTLAIYVNWIHKPLQTEIGRTRSELASLQQKAGNPAVLAQKRAQLIRRDQELKQLQTQKTTLEQQWDGITGGSADPARRSERIESLTALLKGNGLTVIEQAPAEGGKDSAVPKALESVAKRMAETGERQKPQLWRFRIHGTYSAVLRALSQLGEGDASVIPLGLAMKESGNPIHEWTLLVWI